MELIVLQNISKALESIAVSLFQLCLIASLFAIYFTIDKAGQYLKNNKE
jgi:hypothetical protein